MRPMIFSLVVAMLVLAAGEPAHAFRSTSSESYTDPDFKGFHPKRMLIVVNDADSEMRQEIETRFAAAMQKKGVSVVTARALFPPTREWTAEAQAQILAKEQVEAVMVIAVGAHARAVIPVMTQQHNTTTVNTSVYGNSAQATGTSTSTAVPIYGAKSKAAFSAVMRDVATGRIAWYADVTVKASGTLFVSDKGDAKGVVGEVAEALGKDGHLSR